MKENGIFKPYLMLRQLNLIKLCLLLSIFTLLSASLIAGNTEQQKQLKGVVKSTDNAPLPGVTVVVKGGIHVAEYLTTLPPREVLQAKLHEAIARSRARLENRGEEA